MPFDAMPQGPAFPPAPLLYILPARRSRADDSLASAEIASLRRLGIPVVVASSAIPGAVPSRNPLALLRAGRFALAQQDMPAGLALRLGASVAAAFRQHGCGAIHVAAADEAATVALVGARIAGATLSMAVRERDEQAPADGLARKLRAAGLALASGPAMAARLRGQAPRARIRAVPPAIEGVALAAAPPADRNGRLLCLAPMEEEAGLPRLLAALASLAPDQRPVVDFIGSGRLLDILRAEALELGVSDHARFLGARDDRWLAAEGPRYLGLATPTPGAADQGAADQALQAMALRLPVVALAAPAVQDIVQPDCGHLVPAGDVQALGRALRWLAIMPEDHRRRLGEAGRDRVLGGHTMGARAAALAQAIAHTLLRNAA